MEELEIEIRPSETGQLDLIQSEFSPNDLIKHHYKRHEVQEKDDGVYLIAWYKGKPLGHCMLLWRGPEQDTSNKYPYPTPYLEGIGTRSAFRNKGIGTKLIQEAERLVKEKRLSRVGLAVGSSDNPNAKRLYEKLGYQDWEQGEFVASWEYKHKDGREGTESEVCTVMFKDLI